MSVYDSPMRGPDGTAQLTRLLDQALIERRRRLYVRDVQASSRDECAVRRARAAHLVERMLSTSSPAMRDCSPYLIRLMGGLQLASDVIEDMVVKIDPVPMHGDRARAVAIATADIVRFLETSASPDTKLDARVVLTSEAGHPVLAITALGCMSAVASAAATRGYDRARRIVSLVQGGVERVVEEFGMTVRLTLQPCR